MVTKNCILEKYKNGIPVIGTITHLKSPTAVECIGVAGLDYVMIDMGNSSHWEKEATA